jgi:hypothetical protein
VGQIESQQLEPDLEPGTGIDLSLIRENLRLTVSERILANDDTVNFGELLRAAINQKHAEPTPTVGETD